MTTNNPVTIVTIKNKIPLFKGDVQADAIEVVELEEVGYELVANKNLYQIGDKAVLIQPDYCVSDISLFESFIRPTNPKTGLPDESLSKLGSVGGEKRRIRAKKFTLSKEPNGDPVYSNGILLPMIEVMEYLETLPKYKNYDRFVLPIDNAEVLGITKYEEPEPVSKNGLKSGQTEGKFPEGLYKTDETNINNLWNHLENKIGYPVTLVGTEKIDGSSVSIGVTPSIPEGFICSRNLRKRLTIKKVVSKRLNMTFWETIKSWFGVKVDLNTYEEVENDDDFVRYGKPYLDIILKDMRYDLILRGELNGGKLKGSGNKNNPASKEQPNIKFFGMDRINELGIAEKVPYDDFIGHLTFLSAGPTRLGFVPVKEVFVKEFNSKEEILQKCNQYFKKNMIEGIVIRTLDSKFSAKVMNLEYDSKK
jgi:hypothetical protein